MIATRDLADNWHLLAKCRGRDWSWWELIGGETFKSEGKLTEANQRAIRICAACPVARDCFDEALAVGDRGVIRGGIALWMRMERYRCSICRKVGLRTIARPGHEPRRYCKGGCRSAGRSVAAGRQRGRAA